jgi:RNA polymerase sigma-70 factor (ECF subfamily)
VSERAEGSSERARVERAREGDAQAFAELYRAHEPDVARLCRRLLGPGAAAEDATGEVFLRARRSLDGFRAGRPLRPWLLAIAGHHCIDQIRRGRAEALLFDGGDSRPDELAGSGPSPLQQVLRAEARQATLAAIDALPARYRVPLVLRYFAELDYAAIADALGTTPNQVATLLFRAKRRLRSELAPGSGGEDAP